MTDHTAEIEAALAEDDASQAAIEEAEVIAARIVADALEANPPAAETVSTDYVARVAFLSYASGVLPALLVRLDNLNLSSEEAVDDIAEPLTADVLNHISAEAKVAELARASGQMPVGAGGPPQYVTPHPGSEVL